MSIAGKWFNELGSVMDVTVDGCGAVTGEYCTAVGEASGQYALVGWSDPEVGPTGSTAVGFTVLWNNEAGGDSHSVTTWSGQLQTVGSQDVILTHWLLTIETSPTDSWQSTLIGSDTFSRQPATARQQAMRRARGPASHPERPAAGG